MRTRVIYLQENHKTSIAVSNTLTDSSIPRDPWAVLSIVNASIMFDLDESTPAMLREVADLAEAMLNETKEAK